MSLLFSRRRRNFLPVCKKGNCYHKPLFHLYTSKVRGDEVLSLSPSILSDEGSQSITMSPISVHFFSNNPTTSYDNFGVLWYLVDIDKSPRKASEEVDEWKGISEGDLVVFPSLLSGAGEFESLRIAGPKTNNMFNEQEQVLPLLTAGIEYPEFPSLIVSMAQEQGVSLREMYELPFNAVLGSQTPSISLKDVLGGDAPYEEFWKEPPVVRRRRPPGGDPHRILLSDCVWVKTMDGSSFVTSKNDKDEEL